MRKQSLNVIQPSTFRALSRKNILHKAKFSSLEVQHSHLASHSPCCPKDLSLHCFMVTSAQPALWLYIPHQLLVAENKIQPSTSPLGSFISWRGQLSSVNLLEYMCCTILSLQQAVAAWKLHDVSCKFSSVSTRSTCLYSSLNSSNLPAI